jgi:hypothetical protein
MSAELNIAIVTAAQLNRESHKKLKNGEIIRSDGVSETIGIAHVSETILTLNRSRNDEENQKMIVCLDKCRDARAGLLIECNTDMRTLTTHDISLGFVNLGYDTPKEVENDED